MAADPKDLFRLGLDVSAALVPSGGATNAQGVNAELVVADWVFPVGRPGATSYRDITGGITNVNMPLGPQFGSTTTPVSASRSTTWDVLAAVSQTRATTWDALSQRSNTRATTWDVLSQRSSTRATTWRVAGSVTGSRATTWDVLSTLTPAARSTTWNVLFSAPAAQIAATRRTFWNVNRPAYRLIQQTGDEVWTLQLPAARYGIPRASTLLFKDGAVTFKQSPLDVELRAADWYVIGGHDDLLTEAQAADLTTAGYGSLLETV